MNNLVLNFLILEGYEAAAKKFAAEANLTPKVPTDSIHERVEIRSAIARGEITHAIQLINDLNPEVSVPCHPDVQILLQGTGRV